MIPPVNVTLGETMTFAGSDKPEMMTAWILEDVFETTPPDRTGWPGGELETLFDWNGGRPTWTLVGTNVVLTYSP